MDFERIVYEWRLNENYSDIFKATLCSLIEVNVANRITENVLLPWLEVYREEIMARKDFTINDPPQLIINEVQMIRKTYDNLSASKAPLNPTLIPLNPPLQPSIYTSEVKKIGVPI